MKLTFFLNSKLTHSYEMRYIIGNNTVYNTCITNKHIYPEKERYTLPVQCISNGKIH